MDEEPKTQTRDRASQPGLATEDAVSLDDLLVAHCCNATTDLPRGVLGTATATDLLRVLPAASRLGLPDITGYGADLFAALVEHGLLPARPCPRVVPAALALVARVSPLVEARSARTWTLWLARVRAPGSAIASAVRAATPSSDVAALPVTPPPRARRAPATPGEPDPAAAELAQLRSDVAIIRRMFGIPDSDDRPLVEIIEPMMRQVFTIVQEAQTTEEELEALHQRAEAAERDLELARTALAALGINLDDLAPRATPAASPEEQTDATSLGGPDEGRYWRRAIRTDGQPTYYQRLRPPLPPEECPSRWPGVKPRDEG